VGLKAEVMPRVVRDVTFHRLKDVPYCEVSSKTNMNCDEPFLCLTRLLTELTREQLAAFEEEIAKANATPLPDDDDDL